MRMRPVLLGVGAAGLLLVTMFACEVDQSGGGPAPSWDGSPFDGGGVDGAHTPALDANVEDANQPDTPELRPVSVTVRMRTGPKANVRIVFHDASGAVLETKLTGADGKATSTGAVPAMASALLGTTSAPRILTWTDVENGDELQVLDDASNVPALGDYDVTLPGPFAGTALYRVTAGLCSTGARTPVPVSLRIFPPCVGAQGAVLVSASDDADNVTAFSFKKGQPLPRDGGEVAVATSAWSVPRSVTVTLSNPPKGSFEAELLQIVGGVGFGTQAGRASGASVPFATATGFADALQGTAHWSPGRGSTLAIARRVAPSTSIPLDAAQALAAITSSSVLATNPRRPVASWETTSTAGADGGVVHLESSAAGRAFRWSFVVRPGATSVTAPAMPPEAEAALPAADAGVVYSAPEIYFFESDLVPSYAAFRREPVLARLAQSSLGRTVVAVPANGTARASIYVAPTL